MEGQEPKKQEHLQQKHARRVHLSPGAAPSPMALLALLRGFENGTFTSRHKERLLRDTELGPRFAKLLQNCSTLSESVVKAQAGSPGVATKYLMCTIGTMCPGPYQEWRSCVMEEADTDSCRRHREDLDRCGADVAQLMMRQCLKDDTY
eukprot:TRINITY_DN4707_c0_g1_i2.p1 TRINITY_DN4707_c0_g1~~TRINITY_DN4707_c0_g1_i2.p1  ORF type:complete len:149 (+),score=28.84 TRINITY_DN4707_c0_g1_i2:115-561(+)